MSTLSTLFSKRVLTSLVVSAALLGSAAIASAQEQRFSPGSEIVVSDNSLNRFVFPAPVSQIVFPTGAPVKGEPTYLSNNTQVLVEFNRGVDKVVQMVVELETGEVLTLDLRPKQVAGVVHQVRSGAKGAPAATNGLGPEPLAQPPYASDVELLKQIVSGQIPPGFEQTTLPAPARFDRFSVIPLVGWSDDVYRKVTVFSLVAEPGQSAVVAPQQFYRPGLAAITIDGDVVDEHRSPTLYIVEELTHE